jgi:Fe-S-cluster containining protein
VDTLHRYRQFIREVDCECTRLFKTHQREIRCRKGCGECCEDISVLPVEIASIQDWLTRRKKVRYGCKPHDEDRNRNRTRSCIFIHPDNASCTIYPARPFICRVHGLPLRYVIEEYDQRGERTRQNDPSWQLVWCEKNFTATEETGGPTFFPAYMTVNMEEYYSRLTAINSAFLKEQDRNESDTLTFPLSSIYS